MVELTARVAIESLLRATNDDATPIIRRLARIQARAILDEAPTPPTLSEDLREVFETGRFLLDRLVEHEVRMSSDDDAREWYGHVTPAMERYRAALAQVKAS